MSSWPLSVKREHVALLAYCWVEMIPRYYPCIETEDAARTFAMFRADPTDARVSGAKRLANEMWLLYVQSN